MARVIWSRTQVGEREGERETEMDGGVLLHVPSHTG